MSGSSSFNTEVSFKSSVECVLSEENVSANALKAVQLCDLLMFAFLTLPDSYTDILLHIMHR